MAAMAAAATAATSIGPRRVDRRKKVVTIYISAHGGEMIDEPLLDKNKFPTIQHIVRQTRILSMAGTTGTIGLGLGTSRSVIAPEMSITEVEMYHCYKVFTDPTNKNKSTFELMEQLSKLFKIHKLIENKEMDVPLQTKDIQRKHKIALRSADEVEDEEDEDVEDVEEDEYDEDEHDEDETAVVPTAIEDLAPDEEELEIADGDLLLVGKSVLEDTYCDIIRPIYNRVFQLAPNDDGEEQAFRVHYGIHLVDLRGFGDQHIYTMTQRGLDYNNMTTKNRYMCLFAKQFYDYFIEKQFLEKIKQQRKQDKRIGALKPTRVRKDKHIINITLSDILDYFARYGIDVVNIIDPSCRSVAPEELICVLNGSRVKKRERDASHVDNRAGTKKQKNKRHTSKKKLHNRKFYNK